MPSLQYAQTRLPTLQYAQTVRTALLAVRPNRNADRVAADGMVVLEQNPASAFSRSVVLHKSIQELRVWHCCHDGCCITNAAIAAADGFAGLIVALEFYVELLWTVLDHLQLIQQQHRHQQQKDSERAVPVTTL
jgi:hypothetical protein